MSGRWRVRAFVLGFVARCSGKICWGLGVGVRGGVASDPEVELLKLSPLKRNS